MSIRKLDYKNTLSKYMQPEGAAAVAAWIIETGCHFRISRPRSSKLGDYRPKHNGLPHRISVNADLNQHAFFLTCVHEFAHLRVREKYKKRVTPHGEEWKQAFKEMMEPFLASSFFPEDVKDALLIYMEDPAATSCSDENLLRVLGRYDRRMDGILRVEEVEEGAVFAIKGGKRFIKGPRMRKHYKCIDFYTNQEYRVMALTECVLVENGELVL